MVIPPETMISAFFLASLLETLENSSVDMPEIHLMHLEIDLTMDKLMLVSFRKLDNSVN